MNQLFFNSNRLLVLLFSFIALLLAFIFTQNAYGETLIDESFNQALIVFASAKALNAVISLAQGTYLDVAFLSLSIGEVLDPINDLVEQFSFVILAALTSLGIQKILLSFVSSLWFNVLLALCLIVTNIWLFIRTQTDNKIKTLLLRTTVLLLFLRFAVPVMTYANDWIYIHVVKQQYNIEQLNENVLSVKEEIKEVTSQTLEEKKEESFLNKISKAFDSSYYQNKVAQYEKAAENSSKYIIELIIAFVFQTLFLPILFLIILYQLIKIIFSRKVS